MKSPTKDLNLDPSRIYEAIAEGVDRALWRMITSVTDMPGSDFYDTIDKAAREAFEKIAEFWIEKESRQ